MHPARVVVADMQKFQRAILGGGLGSEPVAFGGALEPAARYDRDAVFAGDPRQLPRHPGRLANYGKPGILPGRPVEPQVGGGRPHRAHEGVAGFPLIGLDPLAAIVANRFHPDQAGAARP